MCIFPPLARLALAAIFAACTLLLPGQALAKEYGQYDLKLLLGASPPPGKGGTFNVAYLDRVLQDLGQHAANYPPQFDSARDQQRAQRDVGFLMGMLDAGFGNTAPPELLLRMGVLGVYGHNLQVPNAAAYAQARFTMLLEHNPEHAAGNYQFGQFLAASGRSKEAMPYLMRAKDKGVVPASYTLGMVYLGLGDKPRAIEMLTAYQRAEPTNGSVGKLIQAIREGKMEVKRVGGK